MRRFLTLLSVMLLSATLLFGQSRVVTGKVTDANGAPIEGASVVVAGTREGTSTDAQGNFRLSVPVNGSIEVSGVGYALQRVNTRNNSTVNVSLASSGAGDLNTVVVTALGVQRQAKELGYSTAKVRAQELTQAKVVNMQNGLTGKVSGLNIQTVNNGVFADTRINLRGIRSLTGNNQPMLIVDGVPIALSYLSTLNPNDIQDVTILKSSSSTAIYGPEGVNGAIVVTTKKGIKGRQVITVSHTSQFEKVAYLPKLQYMFGSGSAEDANGNGVYDPIENQTYGDAFDGSIREIGNHDADGNAQMETYSAKPDQKKKFWDVGLTNQTDVSLSAGDFYLSGQKVSIKGIMPGDKNDRMSLNMSSSKEFNKLKAGFNVRYTRGNYDVNDAARYTDDVYWILINQPPQIEVTKYKNWRTDKWASPDNYYNQYYGNPYFYADNYRERGNSNDLIGNLQFDYKLLPNLNLTYRVGGTVNSGTSKSTAGAYTYSAYTLSLGKSYAVDNLKAQVVDQTFTSNRLNSEFFAAFNQDFGKVKMNALAGHSFRETNANNTNVSSNNVGIPEVFNVALRKGELVGGSSVSKSRLQRFFGKVGFTFNDWFNAEVTGSYDTDSRLSDPYNNQGSTISYFYPGASMAMILTDAIPTLKNNFLSFAKLRGALSKTGNVNLGAYSLQNTYSQVNGFPYGSTLGFTANDVLRLNKYKPEFVINKEVGLELGFINNRILFETTVYQQENQNQLIEVNYSAATGYPSALLNAADFTNKGLELDLKLLPLIKINNLSIDFKANYSYQTNKVNKLVEGVDELGIGNGNYIIKGMPAYTFKLTDYIRDSLGRVVVDASTGYPTVDPNLSTFGQTIPKHYVGLSSRIAWKNLSLNVVADYRGGAQVYHGIGPDLDFAGLSIRSAQYGRKPFIFPNSSIQDATGKYVANTSVYTQSGGYAFWSQAVNRSANSNYITSADFWKLREVSLMYEFPASFFGGKTIKGGSVSIMGRNLVTWLPKSNEWTDPEFSNTTGNAQGVNTSDNTPPTRIIGMNVTLNF